MKRSRGKKVNAIDEQIRLDDHACILAITKAQAIVYYDMDGVVVDANQNFERLLGFSKDELLGKHMSMFVDEQTRRSPEYRALMKETWDRLLRGEECSGEAKRVTKSGKEIWVEYSYTPLPGPDGKTYKVVNVVRDTTERTLATTDYKGQIAAINKAQAVIEFNMDGVVISANDNFLNALGYTLAEVKGKHHSMFVDEAYKQSAAYKEFWAKLNRGEYDAAEYKRIGKGGKEVWIQASYNPILDLEGKPFKVVKYATDVTEQKLRNADYQGQMAAISKAQAVIEFEMDGTVITANENFLKALGYSLEEIKGQKHSLFVEESYRKSAEYADFWTKLRRGEYQAAEYKRIGKGGREVWIQASYNPILDLNGRPFKVVKYATDITPQKAAVNALLADAAMLSKAAVEGKLATRADASKHHGDFRKVVEGVNATLDAVIGPLKVAAKYVDEIGKGQIPPKITDSYSGDFNTIKNNLNACIDGLAGLQEGTEIAGRMALNDYTKAVSTNYVGIFADLANGINGVRDRVRHLVATMKKVAEGNFEDLGEYKKVGRRSEQDELMPALIAMMSNIEGLIADAAKLSSAAVAGKLSTRADATKHSGDFRKIVEGVNATLDAVIDR